MEQSQAIIFREVDNGIETLGTFHYDNFKCDSLELPYKDNQRRVSCVPAGKYICKKVLASSHIPYTHIAITNVPNRDGICIHKANYVSDLLGCVGVGDGLKDINKDGQLDIINSKNTFDKLMLLLPDEFTLNIIDNTINA